MLAAPSTRLTGLAASSQSAGPAAAGRSQVANILPLQGLSIQSHPAEVRKSVGAAQSGLCGFGEQQGMTLFRAESFGHPINTKMGQSRGVLGALSDVLSHPAKTPTSRQQLACCSHSFSATLIIM